MRTTQEIVDRIVESKWPEEIMKESILEVLLDIRDLLSPEKPLRYARIALSVKSRASLAQYVQERG